MAYEDHCITEEELFERTATFPVSALYIHKRLLTDGVAHGDISFDLDTKTLYVLKVTTKNEGSEEFELMLYRAGFCRVIYHWTDGFYVKRHLDDIRFPNGEIDPECRILKFKGVLSR